MIENIGVKVVTTRKLHICFGCGREFPAKTKMERSCVVDGGNAWTCYLCVTCVGISRSMDWCDEFGFGDLREEALEIEGVLSEM